MGDEEGRVRSSRGLLVPRVRSRRLRAMQPNVGWWERAKQTPVADDWENN